MKRVFIPALFAIPVLITISAASANTGLNCSDFQYQIDVPNSNFGQYDPTNFDENDDGIGCESNSEPPTAYDLTQTPPAIITPPTTAAPSTTTVVTSPVITTTTTPASPATPVLDAPTFTG